MYILNKKLMKQLYEMTPIEILKTLINGKMANGTIIEDKTRIRLLNLVLPIIRDFYKLSPNNVPHLKEVYAAQQLIKDANHLLRHELVDKIENGISHGRISEKKKKKICLTLPTE